MTTALELGSGIGEDPMECLLTMWCEEELSFSQEEEEEEDESPGSIRAVWPVSTGLRTWFEQNGGPEVSPRA